MTSYTPEVAERLKAAASVYYDALGDDELTGLGDGATFGDLRAALAELDSRAGEIERLREDLSEALDLINRVEVFVKSGEQIKKPEGHDWFDQRRDHARQALGDQTP